MEKKVKRMLIESKGDDDSAGEKDTKVIGKAEEMDGPSKNIGKKGQEKAKIYNERKVMQGKRIMKEKKDQGIDKIGHRKAEMERKEIDKVGRTAEEKEQRARGDKGHIKELKDRKRKDTEKRKKKKEQGRGEERTQKRGKERKSKERG